MMARKIIYQQKTNKEECFKRISQTIHNFLIFQKHYDNLFYLRRSNDFSRNCYKKYTRHQSSSCFKALMMSCEHSSSITHQQQTPYQTNKQCFFCNGTRRYSILAPFQVMKNNNYYF